jgi:hypothetical protein
MNRTHATLYPVALALLAGLAGCASSSGTPPDGSRSSDRTIRAMAEASRRFRDVRVALAEGYIRDPTNMCVTAEMEGQPAFLGTMGIHYFRPDLLGITATAPRVSGTGTHADFSRPGVLIYEPQADGSLELVAVENLVFQKPWQEAGHTEAPSYNGHAFFHMVDNPLTPVDEAHGFEPHYELHAWVHRRNPAGTFYPFNPTVTCRHHDGG